MKPTTVVVDYLSFTVRVPDLPRQEYLDDKVRALMHGVAAVRNAIAPAFGQPDTWADASGRRPYSDCRRHESGASMFWHWELEHVLFEFPGRACEMLGRALLALLEQNVTRVTRLDLAADIETDTMPIDFVAAGLRETFKSSGHQASPTGETVYIGSPSSDRRARVYRYFAPHPRHRFLRVEHVFRRQRARDIAADIIVMGGRAACAAVGEQVFGWKHQDWGLSNDTGESITAYTPERPLGRTVQWIYTQCIPAIAKCMAEEALDPADFTAEINKLLVDEYGQDALLDATSGPGRATNAETGHMIPTPGYPF